MLQDFDCLVARLISEQIYLTPAFCLVYLSWDLLHFLHWQVDSLPWHHLGKIEIFPSSQVPSLEIDTDKM